MGKILQLTPNSWLIRAGSVNSGLLFKKNETYTFLGQAKRLEFPSMEAVTEKFGKLTPEVRTEEEKVQNIAGYPVKHDNVEIISTEPPQYTKGGNIVFAAGYWALKFTHGWVMALCPKQSTCESYETSGPFRNKIECLSEISRLNNLKNISVRHDDNP